MTRKSTTLILVTLLFSLATFAQGGAAAAPAAATTTAPAAAVPSAGNKVGIIDIQQAILATNEGQRDFGTLEKKFEPKRTELQNANVEIENLKKQLNTQGDKLNEEARANLVKQIDQKQKSLQRSLEDAQADFNAQQNELFNAIGRKLMETAVKYAQSNGYGVIIDASSPQAGVLWASDGANITKPIVEAYNASSGVPPQAAPAAAKPGAASAAPLKPNTQAARPTATPTKKP